MRKASLFMVFIALVLMIVCPALASAQQPCWIEQVRRAPGGVSLVFMPHVNLHVNVTRQHGNAAFDVQMGVIRRINANGSLGARSDLVLRLDDVAALGQMPEDSCILRAAESSGVAGVVAESSDYAGSDPSHASVFIPAQ